ncbi:MAG: hypothetical protein HZA13_02030 [Nitrospirae bacterium]|nr:hypothetical protein [Nitrospirota bacterium]
MEKEERVGWEEIARILDGKPRPEPSLFEKEEEIPTWAEVNLKGVSVERLRHFGDVYLGLALWKRLGLEQFCQMQIPPGREGIPWSVMAVVLVLARFCVHSPEFKIAESWYEKTALDDLLGIPSDKMATIGSIVPQMRFFHIRRLSLSTCKSGMGNSSGRHLTFSSTILPRLF